MDLVVTAGRAEARAELTGTGAAMVRIVNPIDGAIVRSEPSGIYCGRLCEAMFTTPEVVLAVDMDEKGTPIWSGPCSAMNHGQCRLQLSGDHTMELLRFDVGLLWFDDSMRVDAMAVDREDNVIGTFSGSMGSGLFKRSADGELLWQSQDFVPDDNMAVDSRGNIGFADFGQILRKLEGAGEQMWSRELIGSFSYVSEVAFDGEDNLLVAGSFWLTDTYRLARLAKYGKDGTLLWVRDRAAMPWTSFSELAVSRDGQVFVAGSEGTIVEEGDATSYPVEGYFLRGYDRDGNVLWTSESATEWWSSVAVNAAGSMFSAIRRQGTPSAVIQKHAPDGTLVWEATLDEPVFITDLATTPAGDVMVLYMHHAPDGTTQGISAEKLDTSDGSRRRPVDIRSDEDSPEAREIAVDGNGDVLITGGRYPEGWLRKYDDALFQFPVIPATQE